MEIEYDVLEEEVIRFLDQHKVLFLATCADGRVTARAMSCVHVGLAIYFQTGRDSVKFAQIRANPNVALCAANVAIEGLATIGEHPLHPASEPFATLYKEHHPGSFNAYSGLESNVVIRVDPTRVAFWKYDDGKPYRCMSARAGRSGKRSNRVFDLAREVHK